MRSCRGYFNDEAQQALCLWRVKILCHLRLIQNFLFKWNKVQLKAFASQKSERKRRNDRKTTKEGTLTSKILSSDGYKESADKDSNDGNSGRSASVELLNENADAAVQVAGSSRATVLQACIITSVLLVASGVAIRQVKFLLFVPICAFSLWAGKQNINTGVVCVIQRHILVFYPKITFFR